MPWHQVQPGVEVKLVAHPDGRTWMRSKGLGNCARQLLLEVSTIRSLDVILPVKNRGQLRMRLVARPDKPVAELLAHLGLALPTSPKIIQNVVEKIA